MAKVVIGLLLLFLLALAALGIGFYFALPAVAKLVARKVPRSVEQQMAAPMLKAFLSNQKIDSARTLHLNAFLQALNVAVEIPVNATVVESAVLNAFAIPGGELVVYSALLDSLKQPGQLAALLGHEAGHIQYRHSLQSLIGELSRNVVLALFLQDQAAIIAVLIERANMLQTLAYSRELELEADQFGLQILHQNGYAPAQMTGLLKVISSGKTENTVPDFLSTHPATEERMKRAEEWKPNVETEKARSQEPLNKYWELLKKQN